MKLFIFSHNIATIPTKKGRGFNLATECDRKNKFDVTEFGENPHFYVLTVKL